MTQSPARPVLQPPALLLLAAAVAPLLAIPLWPALYVVLPAGVNASLHTLLETVSVVVSAMVFSVGWHTLAWRRNSTLALACCLFAGVAVADFIHLQAFEGTADFVGGNNVGKAVVPFLVARLIAAAAMLGIACAPWWHTVGNAWRAVTPVAVVAGSVALCLPGLLVPGVSAAFFVPGLGLTALKVEAELLLIALDLLAAAIFIVRIRRQGPAGLRHLAVAALLMAISETCFTQFRTLADIYLVWGHVVKVAASMTVYAGLYVEMLVQPYEDLRAAQRHLQASEDRWRMLFHNSLDAVMLTTPLGQVKAANPAACALFGLSEEDLCRRGRAAVTVPGDPRLARLLAERDRSGRTVGELTLLRGDGSSFDAEVSSTVYRDADGQPATSVFVRDISARKAGEREVLRLNDALERRVAQRTAELQRANAELEQLSYGVAHDLRAPLAGIGGYSGALERGLGPALDASARHYLQRIQANVARMDGMIGSVLRLAQLSRSDLQVRPLDLSRMAAEVAQQLAESHPQRSVQVQVQPGLSAAGDPVLVQALLDNLIGNAWKFTVHSPAARIEVGSRTEGGETVFHVRDNGAGFDMAEVDKLFVVFQRLHPRGEFPGHGLGLANVKRVVERHGGWIRAEGAPGRGACLSFTLAPPH